MSELVPAYGVYPYSLKTPLFSDYAEKLRFVALPEGGKINYDELEVFNFPEGSTLIKNFYIPIDYKKPEKGRGLIETRLISKRDGFWESLPYIVP